MDIKVYEEQVHRIKLGKNPLTESFTISARKIEMGTGAYENEWV